jgi:hypothetical protein
MRRFAAILITLLIAVPTVGLTLPLVQAGAVPPDVCQSTSEMPRNYTHGNPLTGLVPPTGYYYLGVTPGPACPVGSVIHLVATLQVTAIVPAVGAPGSPPAPSRAQTWFALFHLGTGSSGKGYGLTSDPAHVTLVSGATTTNCHPPSNSSTQKCVVALGTTTLTMRYDGPDVFNLAHGGTAGYRIANIVKPDIVTDRSTLTITP